MAESQTLRMFTGKVKVTKVEVLSNPTLQSAFEKKMQEFQAQKKAIRVILAYHGSTIQAYDSIIEDNFSLAKLASNTGKLNECADQPGEVACGHHAAVMVKFFTQLST